MPNFVLPVPVNMLYSITLYETVTSSVQRFGIHSSHVLQFVKENYLAHSSRTLPVSLAVLSGLHMSYDMGLLPDT